MLDYTNASWTLRVDLVARYVCRLINFMDKHRFNQATPLNPDPAMSRRPLMDFSSGYVRRAVNDLPKQGTPPRRLIQNYAVELFRLNDDVLEFRRPATPVRPGVVNALGVATG